MSSPKNEEPAGFKVVDKRGRKQEPEAEVPPAHDPALGSIDFTTFVLSLGSSAMVHLGDAPDPETGEKHKSAPHAKQIIDLIAMLREKTKGNLTADEAKFLDGLLYDLQLRFVEASKG
jgi:hypothetical protein